MLVEYFKNSSNAEGSNRASVGKYLGCVNLSQVRTGRGITHTRKSLLPGPYTIGKKEQRLRKKYHDKRKLPDEVLKLFVGDYRLEAARSLSHDMFSLSEQRTESKLKFVPSQLQTLSGTPSTRIGASPPVPSPPSAPTPCSLPSQSSPLPPLPPARQKSPQTQIPPMQSPLRRPIDTSSSSSSVWSS